MLPIKNTNKNELQDFFLKSYTKPTLRDLFSYRSRMTKQLIRLVLSLAAKLREIPSVADRAAKDEMWIACVVPVMQGYWRSNNPATRKKAVLHEFHNTMGNIIFNDAYLEQLKPNQDPLALYDTKNIEFNESLRRRGDEYVSAITRFLDSDRANNMPRELIEMLVKNVFPSSSSSSVMHVQADYERTILAVPMMEVAILMITAFGESMKL